MKWLCLAKTPSSLEPLTILHRAWILPGSMLRLLVASLPTFLSATRSRRHLVIENLALRFDVSERSVSRYLRSLPRTPRANATWTTFLRNHRDGIAATDFRHGRRDVVRCAFSAGLTATIRSMLMEPTRTSHQSPWQNGIAERFVGTVRRELLDHVIVLNERHLRQPIDSFVTYYNIDRTHLGVGKDSPCGRPIERTTGLASNLVSLPRVGGLHHRYAWHQAA